MPLYQMTGKDGKVYRIEGPAGLPREAVMAEILKRAPQAGKPPPTTAAPAPMAAPPAQAAPEEKGPERGFFSQLGADLEAGVRDIFNIPQKMAAQAFAAPVNAAARQREIFDAIDAGEYKPKFKSEKDLDEARMTAAMVAGQAGAAGMGIPIAASPDTQLALDEAAFRYYNAKPGERAAMRGQTGKVTERNLPAFQRAVQRVGEAEEKARPLRATTQRVSDIDSWESFKNYAGGIAGQSLSQIPALMAAGAIGGPGGAMGVGTGMAYGQETAARIAFAQEKYKDLPPQRQAEAIAKYLRDSGDVVAISAIAQGALDLAGPVGTSLKRKLISELGEEGLKAVTEAAAKRTFVESVKKEGKEAVKRLPREAGEEFLTGGAQEATSIIGERALGEQQGPLFSSENMQRVFESAVAEGLGGGLVGTPLTFTTGLVGSRAESARARRALTQQEEEGRAKEFVAMRGQLAGAFEEAVAKYKSEGMSETDALRKAGSDVQSYVAEQRRTADAAATTVPGGTGSGVPSDSGAEGAGAIAGTTGPTGAGGLGTTGTAAGPDITGEGAVQRPLVRPTAAQVKATVPTIDKAFEDASIDFEENYGIKKLNAEQKKQAARIVIQSPEVDPYDAITSVVERGMRLRGEELPSRLAAAPVVEETAPVAAPPSLDEIATAPVKTAIETATAPTPGAVVPSIAETAAKEAGIAPANVVSLTDTRNERILDAARQTFSNPNASMDELGSAIEALDDVYSSEDAATANEAAQLQDKLRAVEQAKRDAATPSNQNIEETPLERAEREAIQAEDRYVNATFKTQDPRAEMGQATEERKAYDAEVALLEQEYRDKMSAWDALRNPPVEEVAPEAAFEPAPVAEEVAPAVPEVDPYEDLLMEVDDALANDEIDKKAYNLLKFAATSRKASPEDILNKLEESRTNYAEQAMRYRREGVGQGVAREEVASRVSELTSNWKADLNVQVVGSVDELPASVQDAVRRDGAEDAQGFVSEDGTVFLLANNLDSLDDATATLYHETLGHLGLRALFGARLDKVLQQIYDGNKKLRDDADAWFSDNPDAYPDDANPLLRALEEVLAAQSEAGQINTGIWSRITAVVKDFGRRMGLKANYSDSEVRAILAQAHGKIVGGATGTGASALRYMRKPKKEAVSLTRLKRALAVADKAAKMNVSAGKLFFQARGAKAKIRYLNSVWSTIDTNRRRMVLNAFYFNRDILRNVKKYSPPLARTLSAIDDAMKRMTGTRNKLLERLNYEADRWRKFNAKFKEGGAILSELLNGTTLYQFDPRGHASLADAITNDPTMQKLVKEGASKRRLDNRREVIEYLYGKYEQLADPKMGDGKGQELYRMAVDNFEAAFDAEHRTIISNIRQSGLSDTVKKDTERRINEMYAKAKQQGPYSPLYRSGDFWVRIGKGKNRTTFRLDSEIAWNYALQDAIAEIQQNGDTRSAEEIMADPSTLTFGRDIDGLQNDFFANEPSDVLKQVFDKIDQGGLADAKAVKDMVFQMYVSSIPKKTTLERMQKREGIAGFSADVLRAYTDTQMTAINRLAQLQHAREIRNLVGEAYGYLEGNPNKNLLSPYVDSMAQRAGEALAPRARTGDALANLASKITFFYLLTSVKSQLLQFFQLPFVGFVRLSSEYGTAQALSISMRYLTTFPRKFGTSKRDENGNVITNWGQPTIGDSAYVRQNKSKELGDALQFGWDDMMDRGLAGSTYSGDMFARRSRPSEQYESAGARATRAVWDFTTGGMHHIERMSREIMYMSTFELEYKKQRAKGVDAKTAQLLAADTASDITQETMFDYAETSKPPLLKNPLGRLAFQFYTFPIQMMSLLIRSFAGMVGQMPNRTERTAAAQQFFGTLGMTYMFAGAVGMPGYSFMMGAAQAVIDSLRPDDEEPGEEDDFNPLFSRNLDLWFREWFLPNYFGPDSDIATYLDLSPEQANELVRGVKMGPISAATDINFGSSLSMDNMFFRDDAPADTTQEAAKSIWWSALGAAGGLISQFSRGIDAAQDGDWQRFAENFSPGWIKGSVISKRLGEEGYITPSTGDTVKAKEEYTFGKLLLQGMGFGSTEVADVQKTNIMAKRAVDSIEKERANFLDKLDKATLRLDRNPTDDNAAAITDVWNDIDKWNARTGFIHPITDDNVADSIQTRAEARNKSMQGLRVPENYEALMRATLPNRE